MGVTRKVIKQGTKQGTGAENPKRGDMVTIEYTGYFYDEEVGPEKDYRGKQFDTSKGRGDFKTEISVGKVIKGASDLNIPDDMAIS